MSPKDMSLIKNIKDIVDLQLTSIKIEGRMKTEHYIATVVNSYRKVLDHINDYALVKMYIDDITKAANRETSTA
jgi:putative protease